MASAETVRLDGERLVLFASALLERLGLSSDDAMVGAGVLVRTDMRGVRSHGVRHLPGYARQIRAGGIVAQAQRHTVIETPSMATLDGGAGLGHVAAHEATMLAIEKARGAGIALVTVRNSNHCGALGHYALMCAEAGLIGIAVSNCPPIMTAPGSRARAIGNGPTAYGVPRAGGPPLLFDAAMISQIGSNRIPDRPAGTGHAVIAIEPAALMPGFPDRVAELAALVKESPRAEGVPEILLPGELEHREEGRARKLGLELDGVIWKELADLAGELGVSRELERARR